MPVFFSIIIHLENRVIYQSIELDALYKTVYMAVPFDLDIEIKKLKYVYFYRRKISTIFNILMKCIDKKSIAKNLFTSVCSPFNSASNRLYGIFSERSEAEIIRWERCSLTSLFRNFRLKKTYHRINGFIFFFRFLLQFKLNHIPFDRAWLTLQNGVEYILFSLG